MVQRTEYRNLATETIRGGPTGHGESLLDVESYLMPMGRLRGRSQFSWGVLEGLSVSAPAGQAAVQVGVGSALDAAGNLIVLVGDGAAVVTPGVDPEAVENVPTVAVGADGVSVPTTGANGDCLLVIRWREVAGTAGAFVRLHAPWLRLVPMGTFTATGQDIALARVSVAADGSVNELDVDARDLTGLRAGGVQLLAVRSGADDAIGQEVVAELFGTDSPGFGLSVGGKRALSIDADLVARFEGDVTVKGSLRVTNGALSVTGDTSVSGNTAVAGSLSVGGASLAGPMTVTAASGVHSGGGLGGFSFADRGVGSFVTRPSQGERWLWYAFGGSARLWSGDDKFWVDKGGNVGLGIEAGQPIHRTVYIGGPNSSGIHIEGSGAGYSFADRTQPPGYVDNPAGERWVWYAIGKTARLWSGVDQLTIGAPDDGGGLDVARRMRMRQGGSPSAGTWLHQNAPGDGRPEADRAFMGMETYDTVGFWGPGIGWGVVMNVNNGTVLHRGTEFGNPFGSYTLDIFGSRIRDVGGGILSIRSGGGIVVFEPGSNVVVNGSLRINGQLFKPGGAFQIDHPLDPTGSYLAHSFVESPERLNLYAGTVVTDEQGHATIELPGYFAALNRDSLVQLTPVGHLARVALCPPIEGNHVRIVSDQPGVAVAWQVSGVRQDAWARRHPLIVEEPKPDGERGSYLHPEAFGVTSPAGPTPILNDPILNDPTQCREPHVV
jgi:hypothetical protein